MAEDLIRLMQRLFLHGEHAVGPGPWRPAVDVYQTSDGWLVKYDLAGVRPDDVSLAVQGRRLTVRGCRRDCCVGETCGQYQMEIAYSHFERIVALPEEVEPARLAAEFRDGMLLVRLYRARPGGAQR
jgi:HSP20 family protein